MSQGMNIVLYVKQAIWLYDFEMLQTWYLFYYYHHQIGSIHLSIVIIFSMVLCLRCFLHHILSLIAYTFRENREFVLIIIVQFMMSANIRISFGL